MAVETPERWLLVTNFKVPTENPDLPPAITKLPSSTPVGDSAYDSAWN
jgi:hypothetical protein